MESATSHVFPHVHFFCTDVDETKDGYFTYSHRLRTGVNRDSHGLKVARMAGMPSEVMSVASRTLDCIKQQGTTSGNLFGMGTVQDVADRIVDCL